MKLPPDIRNALLAFVALVVLLLTGCAQASLLQELKSVGCEIREYERGQYRERAECWESE